MKEVIRNAAGEPFSKWKPAEKFMHYWRLIQPPGGEPATEVTFDQEAGWRWDYAWPQVKVAVEFDGWGFGHQDMQRQIQNIEKQNAGIEQGWRVLRYAATHVASHEKAADAARQVLNVILLVGEK